MPDVACLFISSDLFSSSQFASAIRSAGVDVQAVLAVPAEFGNTVPIVVIDLETAGAIEGIAGFKQAGCSVVAFGPHVKGSLLQAARTAGADHIMTRGQATRDLGPLVAQLEQGA